MLERQVRRMLADPRAEALATHFAAQWLHLRNLRDWHPDPYAFPDFDENLMAGDAPRNGAVLQQHRARRPADHSTC